MAASVFASIVFLKVQQLAHRPVSEQARLRAQLEAVVAVTVADLEADARIVLEASDGAVIVVLRDPRGALRLAERALSAGAAGLPLSAALNHGAVQLSSGRREGMAGDGIAVAASVAEFAAPSRLLATRAFRDALADLAPGLEVSLVPAGTFTDPGLRTHELFSPDPRAARRRGRRYAAAAIVTAMALLSAGVGTRVARDDQQPFVDAMASKYRSAKAQGQSYFHELVKRARY